MEIHSKPKNLKNWEEWKKIYNNETNSNLILHTLVIVKKLPIINLIKLKLGQKLFFTKMGLRFDKSWENWL